MHSSERIGTFDGIDGFHNEPLLNMGASTDKVTVATKNPNSRSLSNKLKKKPIEEDEFFLASDIPIEFDRKSKDK